MEESSMNTMGDPIIIIIISAALALAALLQ